MSHDRQGILSVSVLQVFVGLLGVFVYLLGVVDVASIELIAGVSLVLSCYLAFHVRRNRMLFLVFAILLYAVYSIVMANYFNRVEGTVYTTLSYSVYAFDATMALDLFLSVLTLLLPAHVETYGRGDDLFRRVETNVPFVVAFTTILLLICVYGFGRPDAIGAERGTPSALYEYSTILFICAFYFAGRSRGANLILTCVMALFVLQNFIYGGRITALQLLLVWFFFFVSAKVSGRTVMAFAVVGLLFLTALGNLRTDLVGSSLGDLLASLAGNFARGLSWDTAYSSWFTSLTFYEYKAAFGASRVLELLGNWVMSIFLGGSAVADSQLGYVTRVVYYHTYGGVLPCYGDFYFGTFGVILFALYVSLLMRGVNKVCAKGGTLALGMSSEVLLLGVLYVVITSPRWLLYSPSQITRGLLLCVVVTAILIFMDRSIARRKGTDEHRTTLGEFRDARMTPVASDAALHLRGGMR